MDLKQYVSDAIRTESVIPCITTDTIDLLNVMEVFVAAGNMLDAIKKNVFYGKEINSEQWDSNLNTIVSIKVFESRFFNLKEHQELNLDPRLFHAIIGIATESTELVEAIIKAVNTGNDIDHINIREELGDLNWYQAIAVDATSSDWDGILTKNIAKLKHRYPEKFSQDKAINRDLSTERSILEG